MRKMGIGLGVGINRSNYAQGIFNAYSARVVADGGVVESGSCVDAVSSLLQSASLLLIPSGYKGGKLYAEIPTNGNGDLTWTRASDAFRTNASGLIQRVPWNLFTYSDAFDNAVWGKQRSTISANVTSSPNGTLTADKLVETNVNGTHIIFTNISQPSTPRKNQTYSFYAKQGERNWIATSGDMGTTYFNLANGQVGTVTTSTFWFSGITASMENVGDGWYRCVLSGFGFIEFNLGIKLATADGTDSYTGDGTSGLYIWGAQLVEGSSAQTYFPTTDRLNVPRLSYMYGSCPSALLEPQRTNLALYSQEFDNAVWAKQSATVTANATTSPDGTTNADLFATSNVLSFHRVYENIIINATTLYSYSVFVKSNSSTLIQIALNTGFASSASSAPYANFNLSTGAVSQSGNGATASIINANNGWYRCVITATSLSGAIVGESNIVLINSTTAPPFQSWQGTGAESVYIYGAQLEAGAYPTTYIPTTSSATATRVADSFSRSNIYTNGLISASGGTWFVELRNNIAMPRVSGYPTLYISSNTVGTSTLTLGFASNVSATRLVLYSWISGAFTSIGTLSTDNVKVAFAFTTTTLKVFVNGSVFASYTGLTIDPTTIQNLIGNSEVTMFIQQMALFNSALTDAQCQTLTT